MINLKINGIDYTIVDSIRDCNIHKLVKATSEREELAAISDIPLATVRMLDWDIFEPLTEFLHNADEYQAKNVKVVDVAEQSYEKLELAKMAIHNNQKLYKQVFEVCMVYYPDSKKSTDIFNRGINLINGINLFLEEFAEMYEEQPDSLEIQAGIESVNELAAFGIPYQLAGRDLTKIDAVCEMPAHVIYNAMLYDFRYSKYTEALYKLKYPQK